MTLVSQILRHIFHVANSSADLQNRFWVVVWTQAFESVFAEPIVDVYNSIRSYVCSFSSIMIYKPAVQNVFLQPGW